MSYPVRVDPFKLSGRFEPTLNSTDDPARKSSKDGAASSFSDVLKASVMKVNEIQENSDRLVRRLALGEVDDVSEVSIAVEKAELALRLMVQIRDKLVDAYQQIARMSV